MSVSESSSALAAQHWDPERYARNAGYVAALAGPVLDLLAPESGERILDLGCGDGVVTERLAALGAHVIGVDASPDQVRAAAARGLDARVMDGESPTFAGEFDGVFSNAALHWMRRPAIVIGGVWRALKPGDRFVGELGGEGNVARIVAALVAALDRRGRAAVPWYFPSPAEYRARLEAQGFDIRSITPIPRPTPLPGHITDWLETFAQSFTTRLPASERPAFLREVGEALRPLLCDAAGRWTSDYVRLRFAAVKPAAS